MRYSIGTTYEGKDSGYLQRILPFAGHIEVSPDSIARRAGGKTFIDPECLAQLQWMQAHAPARLLIHGVGLSIGSYDGFSQDYIGLLDELFSQVDIAWHSEHLAYTMVNGEHIGTMLTLPRTAEALDLVCRRIDLIQRRYSAPFLIEHVIDMLPPPEAACSEAAFLNRITAATGCGLILDLYNLECDRDNFGLDIPAFLDELDLSAVRELHLAGGLTDETHRFRMDIHAGTVAASTLELAALVLERRPPNLEAITFEILEEFIPAVGTEQVINELNRLRQLFNHGTAGPTDRPMPADQIADGRTAVAG